MFAALDSGQAVHLRCTAKIVAPPASAEILLFIVDWDLQESSLALGETQVFPKIFSVFNGKTPV
jgi:hypothetical protein